MSERPTEDGGNEVASGSVGSRRDTEQATSGAASKALPNSTDGSPAQATNSPPPVGDEAAPRDLFRVRREWVAGLPGNGDTVDATGVVWPYASLDIVDDGDELTMLARPTLLTPQALIERVKREAGTPSHE